jgi:hypothetical protein
VDVAVGDRALTMASLRLHVGVGVSGGRLVGQRGVTEVTLR